MKKYSRQREAILQVLKSTNSHPNASQVYDEVRKDIPNISLGTVYRNLAQLWKEGRILSFSVKNGSNHFDSNIEPHYHFYCERCGRLSDLDMPTIEELNSQEALGSHEVTRHELVFYGFCPACKEKRTRETDLL